VRSHCLSNKGVEVDQPLHLIYPGGPVSCVWLPSDGLEALMSFLPDFEDDIFISYAHIDHKPLTEGQNGWISHLHEALEIRLAQLLGAETKMWRDSELRGNDFFADKLIEHLPKIAILVSVVSPRYVNSDCSRRVPATLYRVNLFDWGELWLYP
jgi:hypothetical protein